MPGQKNVSNSCKKRKDDSFFEATDDSNCEVADDRCIETRLRSVTKGRI